MKKLFIIFILAICVFCVPSVNFAFAEDGQVGESYVIYSPQGEVLCERSSAEVGDSFITSDFCEYEIYYLENHKGYAKLVRKIEKPSISRKENLKQNKLSQRGQLTKKICLYMTHNDESYLPSDGYDSIYGAGGIHDVAKAFRQELKQKGIEVVIDETMHIPHDSGAYSRSKVTANRLLNDERPDAMFDCHRDGVSKSFYYVNNQGTPYSKIRIVVGKANPNYEENYKFAQTVFALGNSMYPFLFSDIYIGKGHYNQSLQPTDLLFEMGTYLIEKDYVLNSLPLLADVVDTALFGSETDEEGNIIVDEGATQSDKDVLLPNSDINEKTNSNVHPATHSKGWIYAMVLSLFLIGLLVVAGIILKRQGKKRK